MELPDNTEMTTLQDNLYTPESIAWKLYQDNIDEPLSAQILGLGPPGEDDEITYKFELLLSVFMEMLLHMMRMDNIKECEESNDNLDLDLEPNFEDFDVELYYPVIRSKFKKISYLASVETFNKNDDPDYLIHVVKDRYNRVILKNNPEDTHYFEEIDSDDQYDFIPCMGYEPKTKLKDVYAILNIYNKMYKIRFDIIEKIGADIIRF